MGHTARHGSHDLDDELAAHVDADDSPAGGEAPIPPVAPYSPFIPRALPREGGQMCWSESMFMYAT